MSGVLKRRREETQREEGKQLREDGGRDWRDAAMCQGMPGATRSWKNKEGPSPGASQGRGVLPTPRSQTSGLQIVRE